MKKKIFFLGMTVLILSLGLVFVGCKDDSDDSGGQTGGGGSLTITGLAEYNGKYASAKNYTLPSGGYITAADKFDGGDTYGVKIENGTVTLKVWKSSGGNLTGYNGNDQGVSLDVYVHTAAYNPQYNGVGIGSVTVNFTNGVGTVAKN